MNIDMTSGLVPFDSGNDSPISARGADPATAGAAPPLAYFGDVIQQIGRSMQSDPAASGTPDPAAHAQSMNDAIDMLESVVGLMSLYGSPDEMQQRLATGDLPQIDSL